MPVTVLNQTVELDNIYTILVSDIQPDTDSDFYIRVLTLFDTPPEDSNRIPVLILKLFGGSQQNNDSAELQIHTPSLPF